MMASGCLQSPEALRNQCRARMNTLSSDAAMFRVTKGYWAGNTDSLDSLAGRDLPLICPACGLKYEITLHPDGYVLSCPDGLHGGIDTGIPDWAEQEE